MFALVVFSVLSVGAAESVVVLVEVVMVMSGVYVCSVSVCLCCGVGRCCTESC